MKKNLLLIFLFFPLSIIAQQAAQSEAEIVATNFFIENYHLTTGEKLIFTTIKKSQNFKNGQSSSLYIFTKEDQEGFVIVSGNKSAYPILAYSLKNSFNQNEVPPVVEEWLAIYTEQIETISRLKVLASTKTKTAWEKYSDPNFADKHTGARLKGLKKDVAPLLTTTWNQGVYYNSLCPETSSGGSGGHVWAGCVATAQGQIMKYYNYPDKGIGEHSYTHSVYGEQSANFGATTYSWSNMPTSLSGHNIDVATLLYHCGVSVNMNYGPSGSGASGGAPKNSLINYFKYSSNMLYTSKGNYTEEDWKKLLRREIDEGRPMYYTGYGSGGHAFNCDGYQNDDYFHFNWGWGGAYNGYFYLDDLTPGGHTFTNSQSALIGAVPITMEIDLDSTNAIVLNCDASYSGTTEDGENLVNIYNNSYWHCTGKEKVHKITTAYPGRISATISDFGDNNLDVFILRYADRNSTIASGDSIAIADDAEAGTYYILVDGRYGTEGTYTLTVNCPDDQADLIVENAKVNPMYVVAGSQMKVDALVRNIGNTTAPENKLNFYVSDDAGYSGGDVLVKSSSVTSLGAKNELPISEILDLPVSTGTGIKYIILKIDADNEVNETDENLNTTTVIFQVPEAGSMNCSNAVSLQNGIWYNGNTSTQGEANISDYSWFMALDNKEVIHEFTPEYSGLAKLTFTEILEGDLNLILLSGCNENACINSFALYHGVGDTLQQEFYVAGGITYYFVADGNNQNGNAEGAYSLKVDFPNECPTPVISGSSPDRCIGDGSVYLYTNWEYSNFQWLKDGAPIDGQINSSFSTDENGLYSVKVTENGCTGESENVKVSYSEKPSTSSITALSETEFCEGGSVTLDLTTGAGYSFQWTRNNLDIEGANALTHVAFESGTYKTKVTNESCTIETNAIEVVVNHSAYEPGKALSITADSLITCWQFDNWGTDDSEMNNYAGIMGANQCKDRDEKYSAFRFNGIENYIYSSKQFEHPDTFTVAVWFKTETTGPIIGLDSERFNNESNDYGRCIYLDDNGKIRFGVDNGTKNTLVSSLSYNDNTWHLAVVSLSPEGMKLYIDGTFNAELNAVTSGSSITGYWKVATGELDAWPACSNTYFKGAIDDIRIYKRALTDDEIEVLYNEQIIKITLEKEVICEASGSATIIIENSEPGVNYQLFDASNSIAISSIVNGNAGTINISTETLSANTDIKVVAENIASTCGNELDSIFSIAIGNEIIPEVHISSNASIEEFCASDTVYFSQSSLYGGDAAIYSWLVNGNEIGNSQETLSTSNLNDQDVVSLTMTSSVACANPGTVTSNEITVNINPLPFVDLGEDKSIGTDESLVLDAGEGFSSYLWNTEETSQEITVEGSLGVGEYEYFVSVMDHNNCSNSDTIVIEIKSVLSSKSVKKSTVFKAWPNPVKDFLAFQYKNSYSNTVEIEILNYSGQKLYTKSYNTISKTIKDKIYLGNYKNGIYFIVLKSGKTDRKTAIFLINK